MVNSGLIRSFKVGTTEYEASGSWTIKPSFEKKEPAETTYSNHYEKVSPMPGSITGQVVIKPDLDTNALRNAIDEDVFIETAAGKYYSGNMTYVAEGEENQDDGTFQVEMSGRLKLQS